MPNNDLEQHYSPAYWQRRAEETRQVASKLTDLVAQQTVMLIAKSYDELAAMAAVRPIGKPNE